MLLSILVLFVLVFVSMVLASEVQVRGTTLRPDHQRYEGKSKLEISTPYWLNSEVSPPNRLSTFPKIVVVFVFQDFTSCVLVAVI